MGLNFIFRCNNFAVSYNMLFFCILVSGIDFWVFLGEKEEKIFFLFGIWLRLGFVVFIIFSVGRLGLNFGIVYLCVVFKYSYYNS